MIIGNKGKSKEEIRREKQLNRSVIYAPKGIAHDLCVVGYQNDDQVIKNGDNSYVSVFSLKGTEQTTLNLNTLSSILYANLAQRFRISSFFQKVNGQLKDMCYLTIFFQEENYYKVHDELTKLKNEFFPGLRQYGFTIDTLHLGDILSFWNMNMNYKMVNIDANTVLTARHYQNYLHKPKLTKKERIIFKNGENFCIALKLIVVSHTTKSFPFDSLSSFHKILCCTDVWRMNDDDVKTYDRLLRSSFYPYKGQHDDDLVDFSASVVLMDPDRDALLKNVDAFYTECEDRGFIFVPCFDNEEECYLGLTSFGIIDYRNMRIAQVKQATGFYEGK